MADIYPYITENQTQGLDGIAQYVTQIVPLFFPLVLFGIFIISFVSTMSLGNGRAFVFASFFSSVLAIFFVVGNLLNPIYMYLLFVCLAIGLLILRMDKSSPLPQF